MDKEFFDRQLSANAETIRERQRELWCRVDELVAALAYQRPHRLGLKRLAREALRD